MAHDRTHGWRVEAWSISGPSTLACVRTRGRCGDEAAMLDGPPSASRLVARGVSMWQGASRREKTIEYATGRGGLEAIRNTLASAEKSVTRGNHGVNENSFWLTTFYILETRTSRSMHSRRRGLRTRAEAASS